MRGIKAAGPIRGQALSGQKTENNVVTDIDIFLFPTEFMRKKSAQEVFQGHLRSYEVTKCPRSPLNLII